MKLPKLIEQSANQREIVTFGGLNKTDRYSDGEMIDCKNLSSERFPALYPSRLGKPVWEEEGLTDIFWHKNGYLSIVGGELSFTRYAEKNQIEVAELGWYKRFNISKIKSSYDYGSDTADIEIYTAEKLTKEQMKNYVGKEFSFENTEEKTIYTFSGYYWASGASYRYFAATVRYTQLESIKASSAIYMESNNADSLEIEPAGTGAVSSFKVNGNLTSEQLDNLKDMKMLLVSSDEKIQKTVTIKEAYIDLPDVSSAYAGIPYVDLDSSVEITGGTLYPYEHNPYPDINTHTEMLSDEPTGTAFSEKEYLVYKDTFSNTETDEETGEEFVTPIKLLEGEKQICAVGNVICILPDKVFYNGNNIKFGYMENYLQFKNWTFTTSTLTVTLSEVENPFSEGDSVIFNYIGYGGTSKENEGVNAKTAIIKSISYNGSSAIFTFNSNTFKEEEKITYTYLTMTREVPDLDFVCAKGSRLYGVDKNRIYASKYGSPQNFQFFQGGSMDSYYIDVASPGEFTGCMPYSSYVLFFKENEIIKLYGEQPSDYQIVTTACTGVAEGSERSVCEINGTIFYLGSDGVYAYSGGYPTKISLPLGSEKLSKGVGGRDGAIYYLSAENGKGERKNYTYDTENGIWLSEEVGEVNRFLTFNDEAAYLNQAGLVMARQGEYGDFSATFCTVYENAFNKKKYQKFYIRAEVPEGARFKVEMSRDGGDYYEIKNVNPRRSQIVTVPLAPNRCDRFSVRISGREAVKILSFMREFSVGSVK